MLTNAKHVPFLNRDGATGKLYNHWAPYNGPLPAYVMKDMCEEVKNLEKTNSLHTVDALAFFSLLFQEMELKADKTKDEIKNPKKYWGKVLYHTLVDLIEKHITPLQKEYAKRVNLSAVDDETDELQSSSIDEVIADEDSLYPDDSPEADRQYAREIFAAVFPLLKPTTQAALYAWIKADGNTREAAHIVRESHTTYYRRLKKRFREFRVAYFKLFSESPYQKVKKVETNCL